MKKDKNRELDEEYGCSPDEHCCSAHNDGNGYCEICGAVIPGSWAYYDTYGGEPPEIIDTGLYDYKRHL